MAKQQSSSQSTITANAKLLLDLMSQAKKQREEKLLSESKLNENLELLNTHSKWKKAIKTVLAKRMKATKPPQAPPKPMPDKKQK